MASHPADDDSVIFEFITIGRSVKVTAVDPVTGREATIIGPATAGELTLRQAALRKLRYLLNKE